MDDEKVRIATITLSDTRTAEDDEGGKLLRERLAAAGFEVVSHAIVREEPEAMRAAVQALCKDAGVDAIVLTGGTGISPRDRTIEAIAPLFEKTLDGFGEAFRRLSWDEIGPNAMLSRAIAGDAPGAGRRGAAREPQGGAARGRQAARADPRARRRPRVGARRTPPPPPRPQDNGPRRRQVIRFDEAQERLLRGVRVLAAERVAVDLCAGRVLADDVVAGFDMPAFDHTSMDGYAFAAADFVGEGPWDFPVRGESAAGGALPSFERGTACRIFTGARLPEGCDAIVPQEDVERSGDRGEGHAGLRTRTVGAQARGGSREGSDRRRARGRGSARGTRRSRPGSTGRR
jgi:molybdenum cofactor synthesis domain-containing protein